MLYFLLCTIISQRGEAQTQTSLGTMEEGIEFTRRARGLWWEQSHLFKRVYWLEERETERQRERRGKREEKRERREEKEERETGETDKLNTIFGSLPLPPLLVLLRTYSCLCTQESLVKTSGNHMGCGGLKLVWPCVRLLAVLLLL